MGKGKKAKKKSKQAALASAANKENSSQNGTKRSFVSPHTGGRSSIAWPDRLSLTIASSEKDSSNKSTATSSTQTPKSAVCVSKTETKPLKDSQPLTISLNAANSAGKHETWQPRSLPKKGLLSGNVSYRDTFLFAPSKKSLVITPTPTLPQKWKPSSPSSSGKTPHLKEPPLITSETKYNFLQEKLDSNMSQEPLVTRIENKNTAEALRTACLQTGSLFRDRLAAVDVPLDTFAIKISGYRTDFRLVLETPTPLHSVQVRRVRSLFANYGTTGFLQWLGGATGWRFDDDVDDGNWKRSMLNKLNCLQDVFKIYAPDEQKYMFSGGKKLTWCQASDLQSGVSDIRVWLETLDQTELVKRLLRTSYTGPDTCVHWAHHHPLNRYPYTVVTEQSMTELIGGIIKIFIQLFACPSTDTPLGTRWKQLDHKKKRQTEWKTNPDPDWTKDRLVHLLNDGEEFKT